MNKSVLIQLSQKEFETIVFRCVCQAIKLNAPAAPKDLSPKKGKKINPVKKEAVNG